MDPRRSLALMFCAALLGCDESPPSDTPQAAPPAKATTSDEAEADVAVIEAEPLEPYVRLDATKRPIGPLPKFVPGTRRQVVFEVKLTEGRSKALHVPKVRVRSELEVLSRTTQRTQLRWTPRAVTTPEVDGVDEAFLSTFSQALAPADPALMYTMEADGLGVLAALPWPTTTDPHATTVASALRLALSHLHIPTPPEGLSKGATWTVQRPLNVFGVPTWQRVQGTVAKLDGDQLEVEADVTFIAPEQLAAVTNVFGAPTISIAGEGKLRARFDLAAGLPVDMQLKGKLALTNPDGKARQVNFEVRADENYLTQPDPRVTLRGTVTNGGLVVGKAPPGTKVWFNKSKLPVSEAGDFVFGFAHNAPPRALLSFSFDDGPPVRHILHVAKRTFEPEAIDGLPEAFVHPDKDTLRALAKSRKRITKIRSKVHKDVHYAEGFIWPAKGKITSTYGRQRILNGEEKGLHWGIDIASRVGKPVKAPAGGVVVFAQNDVPLSGNLVIVDHGHGVTSSFLHLKKIKVSVGDTVESGQTIATLGNTGRSTGPHLDWRMNWLDKRVDPQLLVPSR